MNDEMKTIPSVRPGPHAIAAARSIVGYCLTRFPCDTPPDPRLDLPWFAEKVQQAIDAAPRKEQP